MKDLREAILAHVQHGGQTNPDADCPLCPAADETQPATQETHEGHGPDVTCALCPDRFGVVVCGHCGGQAAADLPGPCPHCGTARADGS